MDTNDPLFEIVYNVDALYSKSKVPLYERPRKVAHFIIDNLIYKVQNLDVSTRDGKIKLYFMILYNIIDWYREKYGEKMMTDPRTENKSSFIVIKGVPVALSLPMTLTKYVSRKVSVLRFPDSAIKNEPVFNYIVDSDIISILSGAEKRRAKSEIRNILTLHRKIYKNFICCEVQAKKERRIQDVWRHLSFAVNDIILNSHSGVSISIWEMFFAVELCVKLRYYDLFQMDISGHDIKKIIEQFPNDEKIELLSDEYFRIYPDHSSSIKYRYSELIEDDLRKVNKLYTMSLKYIAKITDSLKMPLSFKDGAFHLRNPYSL